MQNYKKQTGFSLMELMVVIAIIGVLAAVAMPLYTDYTRQARFSSVIGMTDPVKAAVAICIQKTGQIAGCTSGSKGVPPALTAIGDLASLSATDGIITATGTGNVNDLTYVLTASLTTGNGITWAVSGTCTGSTTVTAIC